MHRRLDVSVIRPELNNISLNEGGSYQRFEYEAVI